MRKLVVSMNLTLDGFMSGPDCELDWHAELWTEDMALAACEQLAKADTIVLGRNTFAAMAAYWPNQAINLAGAREDIAYADMMNRHQKVVFSKTLVTTQWCHSRIVKNDLAAEIYRLKRQAGKDLISFGSGRLVTALLKADLVDEYQLWIHPVLLGKGNRLFPCVTGTGKLELMNVKRMSSGVVILKYKVCHD